LDEQEEVLYVPKSLMNFLLFEKGQQTKHVKENEILVADLTTEA
jgi:hypothetical protein